MASTALQIVPVAPLRPVQARLHGSNRPPVRVVEIRGTGAALTGFGDRMPAARPRRLLVRAAAAPARGGVLDVTV